MIYESQKKKLKKYRHIVAALISYSIGYFTPLMALGTIEDYKKNKPNFCEWYFDIACKRGVGKDEDFIKINREVIKGAIIAIPLNMKIKNFLRQTIVTFNINLTLANSRNCYKYRHSWDFKRCLAIVDKNIEGHESLGASWF